MKRFYPALIIATLLLAAACQKRTPAPIPTLAEEALQKLPADVNVLMYWNSAKIKESPLAQARFEELKEHLQEVRGGKILLKLQQLLGFQEISEMILGVAAPDSLEKEAPQGYALIQGKINVDSLLNEIAQNVHISGMEKKFEVRDVDGMRVYILKEKMVAFAQVDASSFLGPLSWVEAMVRKEKPDNPLQERESLKKLLALIRYADQMWVVLDHPMQIERGRWAEIQSPQAQLIREAVQAVVFSARFSEDLQIDGRVMCDSEENSRLVGDLMRGGLAALKLSVAGDREFIDAINEIHINQKGTQTVVRGRLTETLFQKMKQKRLEMRGVL